MHHGHHGHLIVRTQYFFFFKGTLFLFVFFFNQAQDSEVHLNITFHPAATLPIPGTYHSDRQSISQTNCTGCKFLMGAISPHAKFDSPITHLRAVKLRKRADEKQQTDKVTRQNRFPPSSFFSPGNKRFRWKSCVRVRPVSAAYSGDDHMLSNTAGPRVNKSLK